MKNFKFSEIWFLRTAIVLVGFLIIWGKLYDDGYVPKLRYLFTEDILAKYTLTEDWFYDNIDRWEKLLEPYKGKPEVKYLEIGVFEGRSALWVLENILTHSTARMTVVDIFVGDYEETFMDNLEGSGKAKQVEVLKGNSKNVLKKLPSNTYDFIYIDGSHVAKDVLADAILSWPLLKTGGLLIFDDHDWKRDKYPFELRPYAAIESFVSMYQSDLEIISGYGQVVVRKLQEVCYNCLRIGSFVYSWKEKNITRLNGQGVILLNRSQILQIEKKLRQKKFGIKGVIDTSLEDWIHMHMEKSHGF